MNTAISDCSSGCSRAQAKPKNGLFIPNLDVAPDQEIEQFPIPVHLRPIDGNPAFFRLDDQLLRHINAFISEQRGVSNRQSKSLQKGI